MDSLNQGFLYLGLREEAVIPGLHDKIETERNAILSQVPSARRSEEKLRCYAAARAAVQVTLARTEQIIDELELEIKTHLPGVTHITLEVEGISSPEEIPA